MKFLFEDWQVNCWFLIEWGMICQDCLCWLEWYGYFFLFKSVCIGCLFYFNVYWWYMCDYDFEGWIDVVLVDVVICMGFWGICGEVYFYCFVVLFDLVDFLIVVDYGQFDFWLNECEGMCGV